jgi:hypothetical protein
MLPYFQPLLYISLILLPFILPNKLFSQKVKYDDTIILYLDIESLNEFNNIYYEKKLLHVTTYFENQDTYNLKGVNNFHLLFEEKQLKDDEFESYILDLRDFVDHCNTCLKKTVFIILNTNVNDCETYIKEYDIRKVINIRRLVGFSNKDLAVIPKYTSNKFMVNLMHTQNMDDLVYTLNEW